MFAGVLPVGFEGGHGTAAGLGQVFEEFNWAAGEHYAITSATAGILGAVIVGMALVNWAARKGYVVYKDAIKDTTPGKDGPSAGKLTVSSDAIDAISFHLTIIGIAMAIGWGIKLGLAQLGAVGGNETFAKIMDRFPLFPLCMIGGLIIQKLADKFDRKKLIDAGLTNRLQNLAMDFLVVAAIATINVKVVEKGIVPLLLLVCAGIAWNVLCVVVLARWMLPDAWFERSIAEMGQSMGVTATGLLLLRVVDPDYETPAADAFAYKQILHEPFMGGGLWTSAAIPLLAIWGGWPVLAIAAGAVVVWLVTASFMRARN
jgi:ESS family glutamate:Na+ symporter